ncbi:MAG: acyltransferase family protein [Paludibacter sp.]|nr:acyltransferase family protein [Paludibacter sp.]
MGSNTISKQWLDTLRAIATLGVIIIHVSSPLVKMTYGKNMPFWWIGNIADSGVRFAVPLFLMLSGATLLVREYNLAEFYKRRFLRVLLPFLFWIIAYWVYRWCILSPQQQPHEILSILQWAGGLFLKEGISKHFWYIYMIVFIYLFVPFIGKGLQKLKNHVILCLLIGWLVLTFCLRSVPLNMYNWSGDYGSRLLGYFLYTGYLVLGYYLSKLPLASLKTRYFAFLIFILSIAVSAGLTYFFSSQAHRLDLTMYSYLAINSIIQSASIFVWIKDLEHKNRYFIFVQQTISNYSYGIYLVHIMVIGIFFNNGIFWTMEHPLVSVPLVTLLTLITSFVIIYLLRKIPVGKYISG